MTDEESKNLLMDDVTVIIVTYDSAHCILPLSDCLTGVPNVIFVDNGSQDHTTTEIAKSFPNAILIKNSRNEGFGAANNRALMTCATPFALLLNPDCVLEPKDIGKLMSLAAKQPDAAIVAPHLIRRNKSLELSYRWPQGHWKSFGPATSGPCCVGFVSGAAMLLNMKIMRDVGFFDEDFFLYYEDEDLCQRLFEAKKQIIVVPDAKFTHLSRGSVKGRNPLKGEFNRGYHHAQSKITFERKHVGAGAAASLRWRTLSIACLNLLPRLLLPQPKYLARLIGRIIGLLNYAPRPTLPIK